MYTDLYLSFVDEKQANSILYTVGPSIEVDGAATADQVIVANYQNIDTLGILYFEQTDPDVEPIPEEGWHVNVRLLDDENPEPLIPFQVYPTVPRRVWA